MKIKSSTMDKVFVTCNTIFLVLFVTITLYPVLNTVALSFNDGVDAVRGGIHLWPRIFTLSNYKTVLHQQNILTGAVVSVARTVLGTIFALVTNALLAYIISRKRFLFRSQLSLFWVITMYVNGGMIPTLVLYRNMNLTNSYAGLIMVYAGSSGLGYLICKGFFDTVPVALREAAKLDGASEARIFFQIVIPMSRPILVYTIISSFLTPWTDFVVAKMILNSGVSSDWTVAIGLYNMLQKALVNSYFSRFCAGGVLVAIPISILFVIMQKFYVEGITSGAAKG